MAGTHHGQLTRGVTLRVGQGAARAGLVLILVPLVGDISAGRLDAGRAWLDMAAAVAFLAAQLLCGWGAARRTWFACSKICEELRVAGLRHLRRTSAGALGERGLGDTLAALTGDLHVVDGFIGWGLPQSAGTAAEPVVVLVALLVLDPVLAVAVAAAPLLGIPAYRWAQARYAQFTAAHRALGAQVGGLAIEYVEGIQVVRAFNQVGECHRRFRDTLAELRRTGDAILRAVIPTYAAFTTVVQLGVALVLAVLAWRVGTRGFDPAGAAAVLVLLLAVYQPLRDLVALGRPDAGDAAITAALAAASCAELLAALPDGLDSYVGEGGQTLSGGERQRVAIARTLISQAPIVLLDEPTAALDPTNERLVREALAELVAHKTVVVVAHRLTTIASADHVVVLDRGLVAGTGTHADMLAAGGLYTRHFTERERAAGWRLSRST